MFDVRSAKKKKGKVKNYQNKFLHIAVYNL